MKTESLELDPPPTAVKIYALANSSFGEEEGLLHVDNLHWNTCSNLKWLESYSLNQENFNCASDFPFILDASQEFHR